MKHWLAFLMLAVVLRIPVAQWAKAPEVERERVRILTITEHCSEEAKKTGWTKFKIQERIKDGFWELIIEPVKTEV
jgi:hypothetical protein